MWFSSLEPKNDALKRRLTRFDYLPAVFTLAVLCAALPGWWAALGTGVSSSTPSPVNSFTFSNLPPRWQLETTTNLVDWFSVVVSGDVAPTTLTVPLTNDNHAMFYRVTERP